MAQSKIAALEELEGATAHSLSFQLPKGHSEGQPIRQSGNLSNKPV